ncbi:MAG TPA: cytochrome c [Cyclobacteriaceae bacterium]|nr:cytochrome c [Cyclobacteriaceae bacterium]
MRLLWILALAISIISCKSKAEIEMEQYYNRGEILYTQYCSNCHQADGKGLGLLYPPLDKSDFMEKNLDEVLCIMRNGKSTPTVVNGKTYEQPMQGVTALTDLDIAEIATYIYNTWDHKRGIVKVDEVSAKMNSCKSE